jgi:hypothetical protein
MASTVGGRLARAMGVVLCVIGPAAAADEDAPQRTDYLTFAQGAVPLSIGGDGAKLGANFEHAVKLIDGSAQGFTVVNKGTNADLSKRGIAAARLAAAGVGETRPIASNNDENGRAMNRRVEVVCK